MKTHTQTHTNTMSSVYIMFLVYSCPKVDYLLANSQTTMGKVHTAFLTEVEKQTLKFIWNHKRPRIAKAVLSKKVSTGGTTIPDSQIYCRTIVIERAWYQHENRH